MSIKTIYKALTDAGMTPEGACGLMGNMMAESAMKADIAQRGMTALTDGQYTAAADAGTLDFAHDAVGYGLCQWTFHTRKAELLAFARARGASVGDETTQIQFCLRELREDFPGVWRVLTGSKDLYDPSYRGNCASVNFITCHDGFTLAPVPPDLSVLVLQAVLRGNGYEVEADGRKSAAFFEKLREFTADMEAC